MTEEHWQYHPPVIDPDDDWFNWDEYIESHTDDDGYATTTLGDDDADPC